MTSPRLNMTAADEAALCCDYCGGPIADSRGRRGGSIVRYCSVGCRVKTNNARIKARQADCIVGATGMGTAVRQIA